MISTWRRRSDIAAASALVEGVAGSGENRDRRARVQLEIGLFLALALGIDQLWGSGNRFIDVEPHPFWAVVLIMAAQYGTMEALVATAASTVVLLAGNMPVQRFDQSVHAYALQVILRPLLWMLASVVIGELRARHHQRYLDTAARLREADARTAELERTETELVTAKRRLETKLAGQLRTAAGVLEGARQLETLDPRRVLAGATDLLHAALDAQAYSLYLLKGDALTLVATDGWDRDVERSQTFGGATPLFQTVVAGRAFVSVATPDGERILAGEGVMAGPLVDRATGTLFGMLKVDAMRFLDFNLSSLQAFKAVCEWIAAAYANAMAHQGSQVEDQATRLLGMKHLDRQVEYLAAVARRFEFDLTVLSFQVQATGLSEPERRQVPPLLGDAAREVLRGTDLVFSHQPPGAQFVVVLPGATPKQAVDVGQKLVRALHQHCGYDLPCTMQVRAVVAVGDGHVRRGVDAPGTVPELVV